MNTCILCSRRIIILGGSGHAVLWKAMAVSEEAKKMTSIENEEEFRHIYTQMKKGESVGSFHK
jgi:hypothetical protein